MSPIFSSYWVWEPLWGAKCTAVSSLLYSWVKRYEEEVHLCFRHCLDNGPLAILAMLGLEVKILVTVSRCIICWWHWVLMLMDAAGMYPANVSAPTQLYTCADIIFNKILDIVLTHLGKCVIYLPWSVANVPLRNHSYVNVPAEETLIIGIHSVETTSTPRITNAKWGFLNLFDIPIRKWTKFTTSFLMWVKPDKEKQFGFVFAEKKKNDSPFKFKAS